MKQTQPKVTTEQIWRELSDRLRQFIRSRVTSAADVDDILQTVFLRIHQNFDTLRRVERMESWVFQITRNAVADHFRKKQEVPTGDASTISVAEPSREENVNRDVAGCLSTLIDHLPEAQKRAVSLYELEGKSQAEIAERESISLSGVKSQIQRGRRKLEAMLRECCQFQMDARGNILEYKSVNPDCGPDCSAANRCG
ncbi:MAG: RNA polymerase sigma factor SigZ [Planctomycetota bacterium]|nr:RNA polymerase sigma factor SigZ [Planctomycetota bacterium]MDA1213803.1 RNA polymerase sigma factor SigZ [Planctomycetota bacterium]